MIPSDVRPVVVCGSDRVTLRVVSELVGSGEHVVVVMHPQSRHVERMTEIANQVLTVKAVSESVLRRAGIDREARGRGTARALVLLDTDDVRNVHSALTAREMDPRLRVVIQMVNPRIGNQLNKLLDDVVVVSGPSLAAPAFVADTLGEDEVTWTEIGGRRLAAGPAERITEPHLTVLADTTSSATPDLLPASSDDPASDIVLGTEVKTSGRKRNVRRAGWLMAARGVLDRRVQLIASVMAALVLIGTVLIHLTAHVSWPRSLYLALGAITSAGIEDDVFVDAKPLAKVAAVGGQMVGIVLVALLTAVVVDSLIGARLSRVLGGVRGRPDNHVIVCGLGTVGARVLELLVERGVAVVGIEQDEDAPGMQTAHRLKVPVILGDGSNEETLREAGVERCQALLAITNGDITNLECGMVAHDVNPDARVTLRMFDHDLAQRVERHLGLGTSRSVSMLVAPAVAAAVSNRLSQTTVPAGRRVLLLTEVPIERGSAAIGTTLGTHDQPGAVRVLAYRPVGKDWSWRFDAEVTLAPGGRVAVAATRDGLARLLYRTRPQRGTGMSEKMGP